MIENLEFGAIIQFIVGAIVILAVLYYIYRMINQRAQDDSG